MAHDGHIFKDGEKKQRGTEMSRGRRNCHPDVVYEKRMNKNRRKERSKWKLDLHRTFKGCTSYSAPVVPNHPKCFFS